MAKNEFKPFAIGEYANVLTQEEYEALPAVGAGYTAGIAKSEQLNKTWRQASVMASVLGDFIAEQSGDDVLDDGKLDELKASLEIALFNYSSEKLDLRYVKKSGDTMQGGLHINSGLEVDQDALIVGEAKVGSLNSISDTTIGRALYVNGQDFIMKRGLQDPINNERQTNGIRLMGAGDLFVDLYQHEHIGMHHFFGVHVSNGGADGWFEFRNDGSVRANGGFFEGEQRVYSSNNKPDELHVDGDSWWSRDSSGKITQGGIVNRSANSNPVSFPISFPNKLLGIKLTLRRVSESGGSTDNIIAQGENNSGFFVWMNANELSAYWEATGY
ncbi:gp53-like domain-containing protein [Serratia marcescens]|uniref:gp53-like domain-containing protein n=1 Tax=Serratia marcescens TaxID=615 RepID=UPI002029BF70|nr:hypothetical protein [Serratia marcescens]